MFPAHCRMFFIISDDRHILVCLTNRSLLFLISVRLVNPCCWQAIAPIGKKLSVLHPLFFPSKWNAHFQLTQIIPETYPIGTQRPTHIQPNDPSTGLQEWDVVSAFLSLTPQREALAKTWRSPDPRHCLPARQSIQSIYCIRGHFHVLFLSHIADIAGILTLSYWYLARVEL